VEKKFGELIFFLTSLAVFAVVVAVLRLIPGVSPTTAALVLLLIVLGMSTQGRLRVAVPVSIVATLVFNFFFIPPIHTFTVAEPQNWVTLFVFLVVAVSASELSAAAQERAREAQKADLAATLLASLSHDLRTPLTAIKVAIENLRSDLTADDRRIQAAAAISEIDRLTRLFESILDMARIDAAAIRIERQWVTPAELVDAATAHAQHGLDGHPLRIDADEQAEIELDPRLVSVPLAHLLENAARYSPPSAPIEIVAATEPHGLRISVTDSGPGMDPSELEEVFDRFFRGRAAQGTPTGTGMGLSISRGLLAVAGGRVWAENATGGGARFSIDVPCPVRRRAKVEADTALRPSIR
jgi:two-component system sensor histidine kinase KdpD